MIPKSQAALIDKAKANGGRHTVEFGSGRGSKGGRITFGSRERDALKALAQAGAVRITRRDRGVSWMGGGGQVVSTILTYELAD